MVHAWGGLITSTAPAKSAISYERKKLMRNIEDNVFTGQPRPEHDAAWTRLVERLFIVLALGE